MLLIRFSAETEWQGWPSLHSCHINIDMCTYSFYMLVLYTSIPRWWCCSIDCHPDSSRFSQLDPLAACKEFQKKHQTKTTRYTVWVSWSIVLKKWCVSPKPSISRPCRSCLRASGSTLELLQGGLNLWKLWDFPTSWERLCHQLRNVCLLEVNHEKWLSDFCFIYIFFNDFSIHSYIFPSLFLRPFLIMKPWRSEGFSMSPRLLQGYVLKTRLLNENPTALGWEMVWVRGTRGGHSEFRR